MYSQVSAQCTSSQYLSTFPHIISPMDFPSYLLTTHLRRSPVERCTKLNSSAISLHVLPFPEPGPPVIEMVMMVRDKEGIYDDKDQEDDVRPMIQIVERPMVQAATDATRGKSPTSASKLYDRLSSILHWVMSSLGDSPITWIHTRGPP